VERVDVDSDDAVALVLSLNLLRRHLTSAQRAFVALEVRQHFAVSAGTQPWSLHANARCSLDREKVKVRPFAADAPRCPCEQVRARCALGTELYDMKTGRGERI
jgi:hypothetical protein